MLRVMGGLHQRQADRQHDPERYRHVHVDLAHPQGAPGALKERLAGIGAVGSAINADSQWKKSRVSWVMSLAFPDHTDTDSSMMFIAAKPATARHRNSHLA